MKHTWRLDYTLALNVRSIEFYVLLFALMQVRSSSSLLSSGHNQQTQVMCYNPFDFCS